MYSVLVFDESYYKCEKCGKSLCLDTKQPGYRKELQKFYCFECIKKEKITMAIVWILATLFMVIFANSFIDAKKTAVVIWIIVSIITIIITKSSITKLKQEGNNKIWVRQKEIEQKKKEQERLAKLTPEQRLQEIKEERKELEKRYVEEMKKIIHADSPSTASLNLLKKTYTLSKHQLDLEEEKITGKKLSENFDKEWNQLTVQKQNNLPSTCPKCNKKTIWIDAGVHHTERNVDSAYSLMGSTTVFVNEKKVNRFVCKECGFEMTR